jgi:hypothetical protein
LCWLVTGVDSSTDAPSSSISISITSMAVALRFLGGAITGVASLFRRP